MSKVKVPKTPKHLVETSDDADRLLGEIAQYQTNLQHVEASMNDAINQIRTAHEERINAARAAIEDRAESLEAWASQHPELFARRKSIDLTHGVLGFRTGTPKLKTKRGFTWDAVKDIVRQQARGYLRITEEVNKEAMLADREALGKEALTNLGVEVTQTETFYVEPKLEVVK